MKQCCNNYCVIRVFPASTFIEAIGTKKACMKFAQGAAKPRLRVCKMVPVVKWDNSGKMKEIGK
jgi:hypothetical protein